MARCRCARGSEGRDASPEAEVSANYALIVGPRPIPTCSCQTERVFTIEAEAGSAFVRRPRERMVRRYVKGRGCLPSALLFRDLRCGWRRTNAAMSTGASAWRPLAGLRKVMQVLTRRCGESLIIAGEVSVAVRGVQDCQVRTGVSASNCVAVHRHEVVERIRDLRGECQLPPSPISATSLHSSGFELTSERRAQCGGEGETVRRWSFRPLQKRRRAWRMECLLAPPRPASHFE